MLITNRSWSFLPILFFLLLGSHAFAIPNKNLGLIKIRVRITEAIQHLRLSGFHLQIYKIQSGKLSLVTSMNQSSEWELNCVNGSIQAKSLAEGERSVILNLPESISIEAQAGFLNFMGHPYRDELRIYSKGKACEVVNHLGLEKYLEGLVNAEFSSQWSKEAIEAQVVAARTYAYFQILESQLKKSSHFDVDATVKDQVYNGSIHEDFQSYWAVNQTRGLILSAEKNHNLFPMKAFYHSTCGGVTELPENVWGRPLPGFKRRVFCPFCKTSPRFQWSLELRTQELEDLILKGISLTGLPVNWHRSNLAPLKQGHLKELWVSQTSTEGRVLRLILVWEYGKRQVYLPLQGVQLREWVGFSQMRSTSFQLTSSMKLNGKLNGRWSGKLSGDLPIKVWHFQGRGNGHGVGMCQWGAKEMGEKGFKMAAILKYYYPDAIIRKLW